MQNKIPWTKPFRYLSSFPLVFIFKKQLLDFPSAIAHDSTAGPFKTTFQKHLFFLENKTLIVIPHQTRPYQWTRTIRIGFQTLCRGVHFTHQSGSAISWPMRPESEYLSFLARPYINGYTERSQATAMSKPEKTFLIVAQRGVNRVKLKFSKIITTTKIGRAHV